MKRILIILLFVFLISLFGCDAKKEDILIDNYDIDYKLTMHVGEIKEFKFIFQNDDESLNVKRLSFVESKGSNVDYIDLTFRLDQNIGVINYLEKCEDKVIINRLNFKDEEKNISYYMNVLIEITNDVTYVEGQPTLPKISYFYKHNENILISNINYYIDFTPQKLNLGTSEEIPFIILDIDFPDSEYFIYEIKWVQREDDKDFFNEYTELSDLDGQPLTISESENRLGIIFFFKLIEKNKGLRTKNRLIGIDVKFQILYNNQEYTSYQDLFIFYNVDGFSMYN